MASKEFVREVVGEVLELVKNIDGKIDDIKTTTASAREVANIDLRVDALERDVRKLKEKVKI
jgi:polyhydroxyalkanoate synthesis regulator phasin